MTIFPDATTIFYLLLNEILARENNRHDYFFRALLATEV